MSVSSTPTIGALQELLYRTNQASAYVRANMKVRRLLISRRGDIDQASTGTLLIHPFEQTQLALRPMLDEPASAARHYAGRLSVNRPDVQVIPIAVKDDATVSAYRNAGTQGRLDNALWIESGGEEAQERCAWAQTLGGVGYYLTLPRDADFGLPDRILYQDQTDDEVAMLKKSGLISSIAKRGASGQLIYAENGDVWRSRRKESAKQRAVSGRGLFTLNAYPRDMVICEKDREQGDLKWAAIVEEIPSATVAPGSPLAVSMAKKNGVPADDWSLFGIFVDQKNQIIGGIPRGAPLNTTWNTPNTFVLIRYFDRVNQIIMIAPQGTIEGAQEIWRGEHGCTDMGAPACPVVEVAFYRTDVDVVGYDYSTPIDRVMALIPPIHQILNLQSNGAAYNGLPRWVVELNAGSQLRGDSGEPNNVSSVPVPGLDPSEMAAVPGTLKQMVIDNKSLQEMLVIYFEKLKEAMPAEVTDGVSGSSAPAYQVHLLIQQAQTILQPAANNHAKAVKAIMRRWHGWLRDLDVPVYFFSAPGKRANSKTQRNLIEFDPENISDSIYVYQNIDTPSEATVRIQMGLELLKARVITYEDFFTDYARTSDARQAVIDMYVQMAMDYVMTGVLPTSEGPIDPNAMPLIKQIADGIRGEIHYQMMANNPNYAIAQAEQIAAQAQQQLQGVQPGAPGTVQQESAATTKVGWPGAQGNVAQAVGLHAPGMGMAPTIQQQLGSRAPGAGQAQPVARA